jgi:uncharacterized membrane protein
MTINTWDTYSFCHTLSTTALQMKVQRVVKAACESSVEKHQCTHHVEKPDDIFEQEFNDWIDTL